MELTEGQVRFDTVPWLNDHIDEGNSYEYKYPATD